MLHHHHPHYVALTDADRRARARKHRPPEADELEHTVQAAASGEHASWTALIERFTARVRAVARRHRLPAHDVDDVVQTTWLRLLEHIEGVREPGAVGSWLETTARRESLRVIRAGMRECPTDKELRGDEPVEPTAERELVEAERSAVLTAAVERLPPAQRRLMAALLAQPELSYAEIAKSLDTPIGSIGPTRARSLTRLRRDRTLMSAIRQEA